MCTCIHVSSTVRNDVEFPYLPQIKLQRIYDVTKSDVEIHLTYTPPTMRATSVSGHHFPTGWNFAGGPLVARFNI